MGNDGPEMGEAHGAAHLIATTDVVAMRLQLLLFGEWWFVRDEATGELRCLDQRKIRITSRVTPNVPT